MVLMHQGIQCFRVCSQAGGCNPFLGQDGGNGKENMMGRKKKDRNKEAPNNEAPDIVIKLSATNFWRNIMVLSAGLILVSAGFASLDRAETTELIQDRVAENATVRPANPNRPVPGPSSKLAGLEFNLEYLRLNPWNVQAHLFVGEYFLEETNSLEALGHFRAAAEYEPKSERVLIPLGRTYRQMKETDQAIEKFQAALDAKPAALKPLYYLGLVYGYDKNDKEKAGEFFKRVLSEDPEESLRTATEEELRKLGIVDG